jgi:hypothetical protein
MNEDQDIDRVHEILTKILTYQRAQSGAPAGLDELLAAGALTAADRDFLDAHAIDYKPHALADYHAGDMFHIPTGEGCMFVGPVGPPLPKHSARLADLPGIIERVLALPRPDDELLLHIELTAEDGLGISPGHVGFILHRSEWRARAATIKAVAAEHGLSPFQDSPELQGNYILSFAMAPTEVSATVLDLLRRGLGLTDTNEIIYACGAIDVD